MTRKQKLPDYELIVVNSLAEIPIFASEDDEREWWAVHEFSDKLWDSLPHDTTELDELLPLPPRTMICSLDEVPHFSEELEALRWWRSREVSDELYFSLVEGTSDFERIQPWAERRQRAERRKQSKRKVS